MPSQFTSQIKIVPDQEQQHISVGLESLSRNLTKIQALKDIDDQAKMNQFNKLVDISLEDFWQRDKDELYQGQQDYLESVTKAYKDYGKEGLLPYQYQSKLDKEKAGLMASLEQSQADAIWYKDYVKQVAWDKTGKVDVEGSMEPLAEWMKLPISERAKIDKSQWFKLKAEEIDLMKEIGDRASDWLPQTTIDTPEFDAEGEPISKKTWGGLTQANKDIFIDNLIRDDRLGPVLKEKWEDVDVQKEYKTFSKFVESYVPGQKAKSTYTPYNKGGGKDDGLGRFDPNANNQYNYFPTTDSIPRTPGDPSSIEIEATSTTSVPVGIPYTQKGKRMTIESVKVMPSVKGNVTVTPPGMPSVTQKKGDIIGDDELQYYTDNIEQKPYVVVSYIKEETVRVEPDSQYNTKTKVVKKKVYKTVPYDDDIKAYLIKSKKFGEKLDVYVNSVVSQASEGAPVQQQQSVPKSGEKIFVWEYELQDGKHKMTISAKNKKEAIKKLKEMGNKNLDEKTVTELSSGKITKEKSNTNSGGAYKIKK